MSTQSNAQTSAIIIDKGAGIVGDNGQILSWEIGPSGQLNSFLWSNGSKQLISPYFDYSYPSAFSSGGNYLINGFKTGGSYHAMISAIGRPIVDLTPNTVTGALASDEYKGFQVGSCYTSNPLTYRAYKWKSTAASAIDITPPGWANGGASGIYLKEIVGSVYQNGGPERACIFDGINGIILHPSSYFESTCTDTWIGQQVGVADNHACLWKGTSLSFRDLNPTNSSQSRAAATDSTRQVGWARFGGGSKHACMWTGSASSVVDLHNMLPPGFVSSEVRGIDRVNGNLVGLAYDGTKNWIVVWR